MLAKQSEKVTNTKIFEKEWLASRKLDGVRCLLYYKDGEIHTASRGGEHYDYSTEHIRTDNRLLKFFEENPNVILDGELFKRFKSLQQISGAARMEKNAVDCDWLEYWIYDCYIPDMCAVDRQDFLQEELWEVDIPSYTGTECDDVDEPVRLLTQVHVLSGWEGMQKLHDQYVSEGFEGVVIRNPEKPYKPGGRTNDMIKIKEYKSSEFLVTGYELGLRGSEDMTFICETEDGIVFKAMPVGDRAVKAEYVENFEEKYEGHMAECTYFNLSDEGVPTQPKLRVFRFDLE
jgi:DNA ligase-1